MTSRVKHYILWILLKVSLAIAIGSLIFSIELLLIGLSGDNTVKRWIIYWLIGSIISTITLSILYKLNQNN